MHNKERELTQTNYDVPKCMSTLQWHTKMAKNMTRSETQIY